MLKDENQSASGILSPSKLNLMKICHACHRAPYPHPSVPVQQMLQAVGHLSIDRFRQLPAGLALNGAEQACHVIERPLAHGLPAKVLANPGKLGL
jgi:hypothetical protein